MCRDEIVAALVRKPFRPFVIAVSDGKRYVIRQPEMIMVTLNSVVIGMMIDSSSGESYPPLDYFVVVDLLHVVRLEELPDDARYP